MNNLIESAKLFAINAHTAPHLYDNKPYHEGHLNPVVEVAYRYIYLLPEDQHENVIAACWCHDSIEDARVTFSNVRKATNESVAEMVRAVTNYGRGRTRDERMPDFVYKDIRNTPYATFVKLCDRIANTAHSKKTGSGMYETYVNELPHFEEQLHTNTLYEDMWNDLKTI